MHTYRCFSCVHISTILKALPHSCCVAIRSSTAKHSGGIHLYIYIYRRKSIVKPSKLTIIEDQEETKESLFNVDRHCKVLLMYQLGRYTEY